MSIKLFIFFVFIIKIVNSGNFCGKLQVDEDDNNNNDSDERFVGNEGKLNNYFGGLLFYFLKVVYMKAT